MKRLLPFLFCIVIFSTTTVNAQVVINEYSCSNRNIIADNNGDYEDYIELYNSSGSSFSMDGWYLTDDINNLSKWPFPTGISVNANAFIKVWASAKDLVSGTNYHTNFRLTQTKYEKLALVNSSLQIVDSLTLKTTLKNHANVRRVDGGAVWGITNSATPGWSNGSASNFAGYVPRPTMNLDHGFYAGSVSITLSCSDPNATIRYTIDGDLPTGTSPVYTGPINVTQTTVVRGRAFPNNPDELAGFTESNTYFINVNHNYYTLSLSSTDFTSLFTGWGTWDIDSYLEIWDKNEQFITEGEGKVDGHGNDSWAFPQKGIDFEMEDDYGYNHSIEYPLFTTKNRPSYDHIILKAGASDNYPFSWGNAPGHMRDAFVQSYSQKNELEVDERSYEACIIYINGDYWGVYEMREKTDEPDFTDYYYDQEEEDIDVCKFWGGLVIPYGSDTAWNNLYNFMMSNNLATQSNYDYAAERLNIKSMIDYCIFNTYIVNCDWINWNTAWWRGRDPDGPERTKWTYALWDEDNVLDLGQNYSGWPTTSSSADPCDIQVVFQNSGASMGTMDMLSALLDNQGFKDSYINRYADLMNTMLDCDTTMAYFDLFTDNLELEMQGQINRWGGSWNGWQNNLLFIEDFILDRCAFIDSSLNDCYSTTGPFDITVIVDPPLSGDIKVSTIIPASYPWTGQYFGGVSLYLEAIPAANMMLWNWESSNNPVLPNVTTENIYLNLNAGDTVIAHFTNLLPIFGITVDVTPVSSGNIDVEGFVPSSYPYSSTYLSGQQIDMLAAPATNYVFDYWELNNHFVNPNSTDPNVNFALTTGDYVLAHFRPLVGIDDADLVTGLQVFPTLTNDEVTITYELLSSTDLRLNLQSLSGQMVRDMAAENSLLTQAGKHEVRLSLSDSDLSPGVYLLNFEYPGFAKTFKVVLLPH